MLPTTNLVDRWTVHFGNDIIFQPKVFGAPYRKQYGLQDRLVLTAMFKSMRRQWKYTNQIRYQRYDEQKDKRMEEVTAILTNATYEDEDKVSIFKRSDFC